MKNTHNLSLHNGRIRASGLREENIRTVAYSIEESLRVRLATDGVGVGVGVGESVGWAMFECRSEL